MKYLIRTLAFIFIVPAVLLMSFIWDPVEFIRQSRGSWNGIRRTLINVKRWMVE